MKKDKGPSRPRVEGADKGSVDVPVGLTWLAISEC